MPNVKIERKTNTISITELGFGDWFIYADDIFIWLYSDDYKHGNINALEIKSGAEITFSRNAQVELIADKNISITIKAE